MEMNSASPGLSSLMLIVLVLCIRALKNTFLYGARKEKKKKGVETQMRRAAEL